MTQVILASASQTRLGLLTAAKVPLTSMVSAVDETEVKASMRADGASAGQTAELLAELKAVRISRRHPQALVIGADQMLECDGVWYDKPANQTEAKAQLRALRGKTHALLTAAAVVMNGRTIWHRNEVPRLTMRNFSDEFLDGYLEQAGDAVLSSVGAYQLEGLGAQLFSHIEGDHFAILGLPLLPLLDLLRNHGVLMT